MNRISPSSKLTAKVLPPLLLIFSLILLPPITDAAVFTVNSNGDTSDANPGDGLALDGSGNTTLRAAIEEANAFTGDDTIDLPDDFYFLNNGQLLVESPDKLTITAEVGASIDPGSFGGRAFEIKSGATLELNRLDITGGTLTGSTFPDDYGSGIFNAGTLILNDSQITGGFSAGGGAIANDANASTSITNTTLSFASATRGGSIYNVNTGVVRIRNSTISGNFADQGGGIQNYGDLLIVNSTISGNTANTGPGGGILSDASSGDTVLTLNHSTIADNSANLDGGGVYNEGLVSVGVASINLSHTIIANNSSSTKPSHDLFNGAETSTITDHNLVENTSGHNLTNGIDNNIIGSDPVMDTLSSNGGFTQTHALLSGSPALDAGNISFDPNAFSPALHYDQRGVPRALPSDGVSSSVIDIGAFEFTIGFIGDFVFDDQNADGLQGYSEPGIEGISVQLYTNNRGDIAFVDTTTTDSNGRYEFPNLVVGSLPYFVQFGRTDLTTYTTQDASSRSLDEIDSDADSNGSTATFLMNSGDVITNIDAGLVPLPQILVTITDDIVDVEDEETSLREAITQANAQSGDDVIMIPPGNYEVLNVFGFSPANGDSIIFYGQAEDPTSTSIDGNGLTGQSLFQIQSGPTAPVKFMHLRMTNGNGNNGGAIENQNIVYLINCILENNTAGSQGGAIYNSSILNIESTTIDTNNGNTKGGGIFNNFGSINLRDSTISNNDANEGGGIQSEGGSVSITNSTISGNTAFTGNGGGVHAYAPFFGAAVFMDIDNSTVADNAAQNNGGGVRYDKILDPGGNGNLSVNHSIFGDNTSITTTEHDVSDTSSIPSCQHVLVETTDGHGVIHGEDGNIVGQDPLLNPLANNGGVTLTHAPKSGSPVIDAGDASFNPSNFNPSLDYDQAGSSRILDGDNNASSIIDIGSVEYVLPTATISGNVFGDINADGVKDPSDLGIQGITIYIDENLNGAKDGVEPSTTTDSNGDYSLIVIAPGTYVIREDLPAATFLSIPTLTNNFEYSVSVIADDNILNQDFGNFQQGQIGDFVWHDLQADGLQEVGPTLPGVDSVNIDLVDPGPDNVPGGGNDSIVLSTTSDTNGFYQFTVDPGTYFVQFFTPAGYFYSPALAGGDPDLDSDPNASGETAVFPLTSGQIIDDIDAGLFQKVSIAGFVFDDLNADGIADGGEPGIDAVTVNLMDAVDSIIGNGNDVQVDTTTTDTNGDYSFLADPNEYYIEIVLPSGSTVSPENQGPGGSNLQAPNPYTDLFTLQSNGSTNLEGSGLFFDATLSGFVWHDLNANGIQDGGGEVGIDGLFVTLLDPGTDGNPGGEDDIVIAGGSTTAGGQFIFIQPPGKYFLNFTPLSGYIGTLALQGSDPEIDSDPDPETGDTATITVVSGEVLPDIDAGFYQNAGIHGVVFEDLTADGTFNGNDILTPGRTVYLDLNDNGVLDSEPSTTTGSVGDYAFTDLPPGTYVVRQVLGSPSEIETLPGSPDFKATVILDSGDNPPVDFGFAAEGQINGFVFHDFDADGIQPISPPPPGIDSVFIDLIDPGPDTLVGTGDDSVVNSTTTFTGGFFTFNVTPGNYFIHVANPSGFLFSPQGQGSDPSLDSDIEPGSGNTAAFAVDSNSVNNDIAAGLYQLATVTGIVFEDLDASGLQDAGELGVDFITVNLFDPGPDTFPGGGDDILIDTNPTGSTGDYSFQTTPGNYFVEVIKPASSLFSPKTTGGSNINDETGYTDLFTLQSNDFTDIGVSGHYFDGAIGDFVWHDTNGNGIQDPGELGLNGFTVEIYDPGRDNLPGGGDDVFLFDTLTSSSGLFSAAVPPGKYFLSFIAEPGFTHSPALQGDPNLDSNPDPISGDTDLILISSGEILNDIDAAFFQEPGIQGIVFEDLTGDGIFNAGDTPTPDRTVYLDLNDNNILDGGEPSTVTGSVGDYSFTGLTPGLYNVRHIVSGPNEEETLPGSPDFKASITLASGDNPQIDFGFTIQGQINGFVFHDLDADGIQPISPPPPGIELVSVDLLDPGVDNLPGGGDDSILQSTTTFTGGFFTFNIAPGNYFINVSPLSGFQFSPQNQGSDPTLDSDTDPATGSTTVFPVDSNSINNNLATGMFQLANVSGTVFEDLDANGLLDGSDTGSFGLTVNILAPGPDTFPGGGDDILVDTITSGSVGDYFFQVIPGDYFIEVIKPGGSFFSAKTDTGSNINTATGYTDLFTVQSGDSSDAGVSGFYFDATIGDFVWHDSNGNGILDSRESGLDDFTVEFYNAGPDETPGGGDDIFLFQVTTIDEGNYNGSVPPGKYFLNFVSEPFFTRSPSLQGDPNFDSDADPVTGDTALIVLQSGESRNDIDAAFFQAPGIHGIVFEDLTGDASFNTGDTLTPGHTVYLDLNDDGVLDIGEPSAITGSVGEYSFADLAPGTYIVRQILTGPNEIETLPGNPDFKATVILESGDDPQIDFGFAVKGQINGLIFHDIDADGIQPPSPPGIDAISVDLIDPGPDTLPGGGDDIIVESTTSDPSGGFQFNVVPGLYLVNVIPTVGLKFSPISQGSDITLDSDVNPATGLTPTFAVNSSEIIDDLAAGLFQQATVSGTIFEDRDANSFLDGGDTGTPSLTVNLFAPGPDTLPGGGDDILINSIPSGSIGDYSFLVDPGEYFIEIIEPSTSSFSPKVSGGSNINPGSGFTDLFTLQSGDSTDIGISGFFFNAAIGDFVWDDKNGDGIQDSGEPGLNGFTVQVLDPGLDNLPEGGDDTLINSLVTADGGLYFFDLPPGQYFLRFLAEPGFTHSPPLQDTGSGSDSDANDTTGNTDVFVVQSGESRDDIDAGFFQEPGINGFVIEDLDGNGVQDPSDRLTQDRTVYLDLNDNGVLDAGEPNLVTGPGGDFNFTGLSPATYHVRQALNPGETETFPGSPDFKTTVVLDSGDNVQLDFLFFRAGQLTGFIFHDVDADGIQPIPLPPGLESVSVDLMNPGPDNLPGTGDDSFLETTTSDADGLYSFSVNPGNYFVSVIPPSGFQFSPQFQGSDPAIDSDINPTNGNSDTITITSNAVANLDAALFILASIEGTVFEDKNADSFLGFGETGSESITVNLFSPGADLLPGGGDDVLVDTLQTDSLGDYFFQATPGDYFVELVPPPSAFFSNQISGGSNIDPATGFTELVNVQSGDRTNLGISGFFLDGTIGDFVWEDLNANGIQDPGEPGIDGITVDLIDPGADGEPSGGDDTLVATLSTASGGFYSFTAPPGQYFVTLNDITQYIPSPENQGSDPESDSDFALARSPVITLSSAEIREDIDAGLILPASISGNVFEDLTGNGAIDGDDFGLPDITVYIDSNNNSTLDTGEPTQVTDTNGFFTFQSLAPSDFIIRIAPPFNHVQTIPGTPDFGYIFTLISNQDAIAEFAIFRPVSISGNTFEDTNGNGILSTSDGDTEIGGVSVYIDLDQNGIFDAGEPQTTSVTGGFFEFTGLAPGDYLVRQQLNPDEVETFPGSPDFGTLLTLSSGQTGIADFGFYRNVTISGTTFEDTNGNGTLSTSDGDTEIGGVSVYLDLDQNGIFDASEPQTTSVTGGFFEFTGLAPGDYLVRQQLNPDEVETFPGSPDFGTLLTLSSGQTGIADFGFYRNATISGMTFEDTNADGLFNPADGDQEAEGSTVFLDLNGNGILDIEEPQTTSVTGGLYEFTDLAPGEYTVRQILNPGEMETLPGDPDFAHILTLQSGQNTTADFGFFGGASINGTTFDDTNGDGAIDLTAGDSIAVGIPVYLDLNGNGLFDAGEPHTISDGTGTYEFTNLAPGEYIVRQELGEEQVETIPGLPDFAYHFTLAPGDSETADFAFFTEPDNSYDAWVLKQFSQEDLNDPEKEATLWGPLADPDNDGKNNLMEHYTGCNPLKADGSNPVGELDGDSFCFTYTRSTTAHSVIATVKWTTDFEKFFTDSLTEKVIDVNGEIETVKVILPIGPATSESEIFLVLCLELL